jgi:uncharacterized membrane protein
MVTEKNYPSTKIVGNTVFVISLVLLALGIKIFSIDNKASFSELWLSVKYLSPFFFAFLLSLAIILISWTNYLTILSAINKSSRHFNYATIFLLLTIVLIPFPTAFLAGYGLTRLAGLAVALYSFMNLLHTIAWAVLMQVVNQPAVPVKNTRTAKIFLTESLYIIFVFAVCTILAFWFPQVIAIIIPVPWIIWLLSGLNFSELKLIK